jgi:DNA-binding transcriptional ArsR family regulator
MQGLHPTAAAVYRYILRFKEEHVGESPTRREIAEAVDISTSIVHYHLARLDLAGLIALPREGKSRMIGIPGAVWTPPQLERKDGGKVGERWGVFEGV